MEIVNRSRMNLPLFLYMYLSDKLTLTSVCVHNACTCTMKIIVIFCTLYVIPSKLQTRYMQTCVVLATDRRCIYMQYIVNTWANGWFSMSTESETNDGSTRSTTTRRERKKFSSLSLASQTDVEGWRDDGVKKRFFLLRSCVGVGAFS